MSTGLGYTVSRSGLPIIPFPAACAKSLTWKQITFSDIQRSPTTGRSQINHQPGSRWSCEYRYPEYNHCDDKLAEMRSFKTKLNGASGRFLARDVGWLQPDHNNLTLSSDLISGDNSLSFSGVNSLDIGDWLQIADGFYMCIDLSGNSIDFEPPVVHPVSAGAHIECRQPGVVMRLVDDQQVALSDYVSSGSVGSFQAIEAKS